MTYTAACRGKVRRRKKGADQEARRLTQRNQAKGQPPVHAYPCPHCRAWHCGRFTPEPPTP